MLLLEGTLLQKLRKIEALHGGTTVDGEPNRSPFQPGQKPR